VNCGWHVSLTNALVFVWSALTSFDWSHKRQNQNKLKLRSRWRIWQGGDNKQTTNGWKASEMHFLPMLKQTHPINIPPRSETTYILCCFKLVELVAFAELVCSLARLVILSFYFLELPSLRYPGVYPSVSPTLPLQFPTPLCVCSFTLSLSRHRFSLGSSHSQHRAPFPLQLFAQSHTYIHSTHARTLTGEVKLLAMPNLILIRYISSLISR